MNQTFTLHGSRIHDISSFYQEVNREFMADESWQLAESLDALNDMLYGGYGALRGNEPATLIWRDIAHSRAALGLDTTRRFLQNKIAQPERYNTRYIQQQLDSLESGQGATYFEIVMEIIADHPNITLQEA